MPPMRRRSMRRRRRRRRRRRILLVGGLVAFGAYKMSKRDADRVKQHTGTDPEELSDEELSQAMDDLGIEQQQVTSADREQGSGGASAAPTGESSGGYLEELERLADLKDKGIITDEEFEAKKRQLLGL
jgi:hypothetical protein